MWKQKNVGKQRLLHDLPLKMCRSAKLSLFGHNTKEIDMNPIHLQCDYSKEKMLEEESCKQIKISAF